MGARAVSITKAQADTSEQTHLRHAEDLRQRAVWRRVRFQPLHGAWGEDDHTVPAFAAEHLFQNIRNLEIMHD